MCKRTHHGRALGTWLELVREPRPQSKHTKEKATHNTHHTGWQHGPSWSACKHADSLTTSHQRWYFPIINYLYMHRTYIAHEHKAKQTMQSRRRSAKQHSGASSSSTKTKQLDSDEEDEAAHTFPFPFSSTTWCSWCRALQFVPASSIHPRDTNPFIIFNTRPIIPTQTHFPIVRSRSVCLSRVCVLYFVYLCIGRTCVCCSALLCIS